MESKLQWYGLGGWLAYNMQDCQTGDLSLNAEPCVWLGLVDKKHFS